MYNCYLKKEYNHLDNMVCELENDQCKCKFVEQKNRHFVSTLNDYRYLDVQIFTNALKCSRGIFKSCMKTRTCR